MVYLIFSLDVSSYLKIENCVCVKFGVNDNNHYYRIARPLSPVHIESYMQVS